jgi:hypothetical protein
VSIAARVSAEIESILMTEIWFSLPYWVRDLPSGFEGHPLRKDFPLLARIVKPWPGIVDVEPMPADLDGDGEPAAEGEG